MKTKVLSASELGKCGYDGCTRKAGHKPNFHAVRGRYGTLVIPIQKKKVKPEQWIPRTVSRYLQGDWNEN